MPRFRVVTPRTLEEALTTLAENAPGQVVPMGGGTDLLPALKLRLCAPAVVMRLDGVAELKVLRASSEALHLGAGATVASIGRSLEVQKAAPALALAAAQVASPQIRNAATLGGNVMLDTRCRYVNQSEFWRSSLGYCLKKDGTACHVVKGGRTCVAALSCDSVPALVSLGAVLGFASPRGVREVPVEALFRSDGASPHQVAHDELLVQIRVPAQDAGHRGAYLKLRTRGSIDFPLLGVAVRLQMQDGSVVRADVVLGGLQSRPVRVGETALLHGTRPGERTFDEALLAVAAKARRQCHPLPNIPGDEEWRQEMVPVYVRRAVRQAAGLR